LVNSLTYVGNTPDSGSSGRITPLLTGLEFQQRWGHATLAGEPLYLRGHGAYTRYDDFGFFPESTLGTLGQTRADVNDEWELGVALNSGEKPLRLWFLSWEQLGIAYRFNTEHDIKGIGFTFRALFDR
jgi:hypothetical protein